MAKTQEEIKAARSKKAASIPEGTRLKRAEQDLAKRVKQLAAAEEEVQWAKDKYEQACKKQQEAQTKKTEAEGILEEVRKLIAAPPPQVDSYWSNAMLDQFRIFPKEVLEKGGFQAILDSLEAIHKEGVAKAKAAREEAETKSAESEGRAATHDAGMVANPLGHAHVPGQQHALAHAEAAKPPIVNDDVLMGLCAGEDAELAKAAKLIMESEVIAKRRKLASV